MRSISFLLMLISLYACSHETELKKSVFKPDEEFPELPVYSEWGYNTFGAYYDRQVFTSNDREVPLKVVQEDNSTLFLFSGQKGGFHNYGIPFSMALKMSNFNPQTYADLISLHGTTLDLTDPAYEVFFTIADATNGVNITSGKFQFIRAQNLLVDENPEEVILSGVFEFQAVINGLPVTISNGRFDVGVGDFNFFSL